MTAETWKLYSHSWSFVVGTIATDSPHKGPGIQGFDDLLLAWTIYYTKNWVITDMRCLKACMWCQYHGRNIRASKFCPLFNEVTSLLDSPHRRSIMQNSTHSSLPLYHKPCPASLTMSWQQASDKVEFVGTATQNTNFLAEEGIKNQGCQVMLYYDF